MDDAPYRVLESGDTEGVAFPRVLGGHVHFHVKEELVKISGGNQFYQSILGSNPVILARCELCSKKTESEPLSTLHQLTVYSLLLVLPDCVPSGALSQD